MDIEFRYSTEDDKEGIQKLILSKFGVREQALDNLDDRYLLAVYNNEIVAMTGISNKSSYNGLEVDWTCVADGFTGRGLITRMLYSLLKDVKADVYCSCWGYKDNPINLRYAMDALGFKPVIVHRLQASTDYYNCADICTRKRDGICSCYEDLYMREYNEN